MGDDRRSNENVIQKKLARLARLTYSPSYALRPYTFLRSFFRRLRAAFTKKRPGEKATTTQVTPTTTSTTMPTITRPLDIHPVDLITCTPDIHPSDSPNLPIFRTIPRRAGTSIHNLPSESLTGILEHLASDIPSINSARLVSRTFAEAAWPAFAKSFHYRIFHPTLSSLTCLMELASNERILPYFKQLNLSTVRLGGAAGLAVMEDWGLGRLDVCTTSYMAAVEYGWMVEIEGYVTMEALAFQLGEVLGRFWALERILVVEGRQLPGPPKWRGLQPTTQHILDSPAFHDTAIYDKKAHSYTLALLNNALTWFSMPTKLTSFATHGNLKLGQLPPGMHTQLTHLDLSIAYPKPPGTTPPSLLLSYLPTFLASMPNLTSLRLKFPHARRCHNATHPHGPNVNTSYLFGSTFFTPLALQCKFQALKHLHFANLGLGNSHPLECFLAAHVKTLTHLNLTDLALGTSEWRPFAAFLGQRLGLEEMVWGCERSEAEYEEDRRDRQRRGIGTDWLPRSEDYAGGANLVRVGWMKGEKDDVYVRGRKVESA